MSDVIEQLEKRIERKGQEELPGSVEDVPTDVAKLERLRVLLEAIQAQVEMVPDPPNTRSNRNWLTANQKRYALRHVREALSLLGEEG